MCVIQGFTFNEEDMDGFLLSKNQVYSNRRVPTQVNTSRHESTRVNTNQHEFKTSQHESDTSQHESTRVKKCPR